MKKVRLFLILLICSVLFISCKPVKNIETDVEEEIGTEDAVVGEDDVIENEGILEEDGQIVDEEDKQLEQQTDRYVADYILSGRYNNVRNLNSIVEAYQLTQLKLLAESEDQYFFYGMGDFEVIVSTDKSFRGEKLLSEKVADDMVGFYKYDIIKKPIVKDQDMLRIMNDQGYSLYDLDGNLTEEVVLPFVILDELNKEGKRWWDISDDCNLIAYTNDTKGLELFELDTARFTHLIDNRIDVKNELKSEINGVPSFIMNDRYISTIEFAYEGVAGYNLYNLESKEISYLNGAFDLALDINYRQGLYVYFDQENKGTLYDYNQGVRRERGITGSVDSTYEQGFNYLVDDYLITGHYGLDMEKFEINAIKVSTKGKYDVLPILTFHHLESDLEKPEIVFATDQIIYVMVPGAKADQRVIAIAYDKKEVKADLNGYFALDQVFWADGQVEIMGEKLGYDSIDLSPLLEGITIKQIEQIMYRSVLFYTSVYEKDYYALKQISTDKLINSFDQWSENLEVEESIKAMMTLRYNSESSFPQGIEAPVKTDAGYSVSLKLEYEMATVHFVVGGDGLPLVVGMDIYEY